MDATELARWTRFAAKGGIGKCTAVQDCVAESPEDLMFLKDDEIIVLMQLANQPGYYLGYCEGVVGRFQGSHVRFHGKLKRPVMTKRASASAVSVASSPVPSVTPSPRMPLSPLTTTSSSTPSTAQTMDRDSKALSDPFDLELDAPPPRARRCSEDAASQSSNDNHTGGRRKLARGVDDLPGLEMFLPRSRSGSRSRPTSRGNTASSAGGNGQAEDEKKARRQTRIITPPSHLQFSSPRKDSLDIPSSPLAQSPIRASQPPPMPASPEKSEEVQNNFEPEEEKSQAHRISTSPEPLLEPQNDHSHESPPLESTTASAEKDESSLYDTHSMRSSVYSTHSSYRSSVFGNGPGLSEAASEAFARLSRTESDDGGFGMGIGLSMLQDMADDDDDDTAAGAGAVGTAPPTPTPVLDSEGSKQITVSNVEQAPNAQNKDAEEVEEAEEEYDEEDDDDDGSYWDGADIYDNYRYSRFSMMTKNSRRKSHFSVMSRSSFVDAQGPKRVPPVPLDAETRLRADSTLSSPVERERDASKEKDNEEAERGRKHVPPPLTFVKSAPGSFALLSPGMAHSPASTSNRSSAGGSPLLHTSFASPKSSSSHNTSFGTDEAEARSFSPEPSIRTIGAVGGASSGSGSGSGAGAASALRQRLEHERSAPSTPLPSPMPTQEKSFSTVDIEKEVNGGHGRGIVVEDDETVNVIVVPAEESHGGSRSQQNDNDDDPVKDHAARDSMQSAVSTTSEDSTATSMSDVSDVSGVMRRIEKDLASVSAFTGGTTASDDASVPTPTLSDFSGIEMAASTATTQPLRVQDRASRPTLSPSSDPGTGTDRATPTPPSPSPLLQQQPVHVQQEEDAKPSPPPSQSDSSQLLRPEQVIFLPHPNAPRPNPAVLSGQRASTYGMPPVHEPKPMQPVSGSSASAEVATGFPGGSSLEATLRAASASRVGPAGVPHRTTIFGKTVVDLAIADGPVAIVWSLSPFPPDPVSRTSSPAPSNRVPRRAATAGASPLSQGIRVASVGSNPPSPAPNELRFPVTSPPLPASPSPSQTAFQAPTPVRPPHRLTSTSDAASPSSVSDNPTSPPSASKSNSTTSTSNLDPNSNPKSNLLLRPNFQPRVGTARPRSRSFSDFAAAREVAAKPVLKERASEEGSKPTRVASVQSLKEAAAASRLSGSKSMASHGPRSSPLRKSTTVAVNESSSSSGSGPSPTPPKRSTHTPSPLSRPENNAVLATPRASSFSKGATTPTPSSPLARSFFSSSQSHLPTPIQTPTSTLTQAGEHASDSEGSGSLRQPVIPAAMLQSVRQVASVDNFKMERKDQPPVGPPRSVLQRTRRNSGPVTGPSASSAPAAVSAPNAVPPTQNVAPSPTPTQRLRRISSPSSKRHERSTSQHSQASSTSDLRSAASPPPNAASPSPVQRSASIKSKLSLSHLRIRHTAAKDSVDTQTTSPSTGPQTPVYDFDNQPETVQVQDAEFEMIRPMMRRVSSEPISDDSMLGPDERVSLQRDSTADSPVSGSARSVLSPHPSTIADSITEQQHMRMSKPAEDAAAHRARELKWMSLMSSVPASQARKNRKIRRLLMEGVPSSVRYLVWSHLMDSKAKRIPGVYGQLGRRGRVAASEVIERDAVRCFPDQPHLQDAKGPLVGLLQTFLTMVPDIEYQTSLTLVAGHLLLQSPEEDAFWIFTSMMDLHLRAYFSSKSVQMKADAMVFGKAVELIHPQLVRKLFVELHIPPLELCRMWFSSLFSTTLPQEYVNRIWDVYLYDGPAFLFRVGLVILSSCRSAIETSTDRSAVLSFLSRPETLSLLPDDPEEFINLTLAIKLKDDDIRKQRSKVEAELRARTQSAHRSHAPRLVSSISLPRAGPVGVTPL